MNAAAVIAVFFAFGADPAPNEPIPPALGRPAARALAPEALAAPPRERPAGAGGLSATPVEPRPRGAVERRRRQKVARDHAGAEGEDDPDEAARAARRAPAPLPR